MSSAFVPRKYLGLLLIALFVVFLIGCGATATPHSTSVPPTITSTRTATLTPTVPRPTNTSTATATATATPSPVVGVTTDILRVRAAPSTDAAILARIDKGVSLTFLARSTDGKWLQIAYPPGSNQFAWVSADFVKLTGSINALPVGGITPTATPTLASPQSPTPIPVTPTVGPSDSALDLFNRTNFIRESNNLAPLKWSDLLAASAKRHSTDMAKTGNIDHTGSDNSTAAQRMTDAGYSILFSGENIYGGAVTIDEAWSYWSEDSTHLENLLNAKYTEIGIAVVESAGKSYYTIDFAQPSPATVTPTSIPPTKTPPPPTPTRTIQPAEPCSVIPGQNYGTLQIMSGPTDPIAELQPDINLGMRGYAPTTASKALADFEGGADSTAPQLRGLFVDKRLPIITRAYQVYAWDWSAKAQGPLVDDPEVSMLGLRTTTGEIIATPNTGVDIGDGYVAMVLYATQSRITLKYTREDHVVNGYTLHLENVCVEPDLLALYQKLNSPKRHFLPALRAGQPLGRATGAEIVLAIRDKGSFMDPRSRKDWWSGQ